MYTPPHYAHDEPSALRAAMTRHPFALLVTPCEGELHLTHVPLWLDPERGPHGTLEGHLARANPHAAALAAGAPTVAVFQGPNAYVSPRWYGDPARDVPTWNYVAVHAHGTPRVLHDPTAVLALIGRLTDVHEAAIDPPWRVEEARDYAAKLVKGVVAFELEIARLEGKFKVSQNKRPEDQRRVRAALAADPRHEALVGWMDAVLRGAGGASFRQTGAGNVDSE